MQRINICLRGMNFNIYEKRVIEKFKNINFEIYCKSYLHTIL